MVGPAGRHGRGAGSVAGVTFTTTLRVMTVIALMLKDPWAAECRRSGGLGMLRRGRCRCHEPDVADATWPSATGSGHGGRLVGVDTTRGPYAMVIGRGAGRLRGACLTDCGICHSIDIGLIGMTNE